MAVQRSALEGLLAASAGRDVAAFGDFYAETSGVAFRLAVLLTRDTEIAQRVVESAYRLAWRDSARYDRSLSPQVWLLGLVQRSAADLALGT